MDSVRMSWWTTMSRTFDILGNDTVEVVFDNLGFQAYGNCQGRSSSLSEIMQIVTSTVRVKHLCEDAHTKKWIRGASMFKSSSQNEVYVPFL